MTISVIITAYNYGPFVREAVDSVLAQTVPDLQVVVVDDGSTDNTPEVLSKISDARLEIVRTTNQGISASRNEGLSRATGDFVAFLDADDRWTPRKLEYQLQVLLAEPDMAAVFCNFVRFDSERVYPQDQFSFYPELARVPTAPTAEGRAEKILPDAFSTLVAFDEIPAWVQTVLFRRQAIEGVRFNVQPGARAGLRFALCMDIPFCLQAFRNGPVGFIRQPLVEVRRHGGNATRRIGDMPLAKLIALRTLTNLPLTKQQRAAVDERVGRAYISAGLQDSLDGQRLEAARKYFNALAYPGSRVSALKNLALEGIPRSRALVARIRSWA